MWGPFKHIVYWTKNTSSSSNTTSRAPAKYLCVFPSPSFPVYFFFFLYSVPRLFRTFAYCRARITSRTQCVTYNHCAYYYIYTNIYTRVETIKYNAPSREECAHSVHLIARDRARSAASAQEQPSHSAPHHRAQHHQSRAIVGQRACDKHRTYWMRACAKGWATRDIYAHNNLGFDRWSFCVIFATTRKTVEYHISDINICQGNVVDGLNWWLRPNVSSEKNRRIYIIWRTTKYTVDLYIICEQVGLIPNTLEEPVIKCFFNPYFLENCEWKMNWQFDLLNQVCNIWIYSYIYEHNFSGIIECVLCCHSTRIIVALRATCVQKHTNTHAQL